MLLVVDRIKDTGLSLEGEEQADIAERHCSHWLGDDVTFVTPLSYRFRAQSVGSIIEVEGALHVGVELTCGRCLKGFRFSLEPDFSVAFVNEKEFSKSVDEDGEVELRADELGLSSFTGEQIDLRETLCEQVLLSLPSQPLCSAECKGLCPECGEDLNRRDCRCEKTPFESKFEALKDFKPDND